MLAKEYLGPLSVPALALLTSFVPTLDTILKLGQIGLVIGSIAFVFYQIKKIRLEINEKVSTRPAAPSDPDRLPPAAR